MQPNYSFTQQAHAQSVGNTPTNYPIISQVDPTPNDTNYKIGQLWVNTVLHNLWYLNSLSAATSSSNPYGQMMALWEPFENSTDSLETLSDSAGTVVFPTPNTGTPANNIQLEGEVIPKTSGGTFSNIVSVPSSNQILINPMTTAKWIVDQNTSNTGTPNGTHTTIQSAILASSPGDSIYISPGTYTENLILSPGIALWGAPGSQANLTTQIVGTINCFGTGKSSLNSLCLTTNGNYIINLIGTAPTYVSINQCYFNVTNFTALNNASTNAGANIFLNNCLGNITSSSVTFFQNTSVGGINIYYSYLLNTGNTAVASTSNTGGISIFNSSILFPITISGNSQFTMENCNCASSGPGVPFLTISSSNTCYSRFNTYDTATVQTYVVTSPGVLNVSNDVVKTSSTTIATGNGSLIYGNIETQLGISSITTTTQNGVYEQLGSYVARAQPCFQVVLSNNIFSVTGDGTIYPILFDTVTFDQSSSVTLNSSGKTIFTAPVKGKYFLSSTLLIHGTTSGMNEGDTRIIATTQTISAYLGNVGNLVDVNGNLSYSLSGIISMNAGDTASCSFNESGGAKVVGLVIGTIFSGYLVA